MQITSSVCRYSEAAQSSSYFLAEGCEEISRMCFSLALVEREPIHVKSPLPEEANVQSSLEQLLTLAVRL